MTTPEFGDGRREGTTSKVSASEYVAIRGGEHQVFPRLACALGFEIIARGSSACPRG